MKKVLSPGPQAWWYARSAGTWPRMRTGTRSTSWKPGTFMPSGIWLTGKDVCDEHSDKINILSEPKKRALWLKIWYSSIEKVEEENPWALAFDESEELLLAAAEA